MCSEARETLKKMPCDSVTVFFQIILTEKQNLNLFSNGSVMFVVHPDSEEDLSPGEFSPRVPEPSTAKKGSVGTRVPKEPAGFARAYDLGKKCFTDYVKMYVCSVTFELHNTMLRFNEFSPLTTLTSKRTDISSSNIFWNKRDTCCRKPLFCPLTLKYEVT